MQMEMSDKGWPWKQVLQLCSSYYSCSDYLLRGDTKVNESASLFSFTATQETKSLKLHTCYRDIDSPLSLPPSGMRGIEQSLSGRSFGSTPSAVSTVLSEDVPNSTPVGPHSWVNLPSPSLRALYLIPGVGLPASMQPGLPSLPFLPLLPGIAHLTFLSENLPLSSL
ncbi:hypothetical protein HPG69_019764 [Diceros bicornis minor]|uniref:Uncharacterized protein n=1 Tax=Diceros bicornis minor TaxID=77932 RepID=A0A7J7EQH8_DICBM|nr:hypothetical protein HPG69_019764 [Diceros bicornis minor]